MTSQSQGCNNFQLFHQERITRNYYTPDQVISVNFFDDIDSNNNNDNNNIRFFDNND